MKEEFKAKILARGQHCIPYNEFHEIAESVMKFYPTVSEMFWMWKMFQFGYVYGKRAERARRKKMSEREFVMKNATLINDFAEECRKLNDKEYADFKEEFIAGFPKISKPFAYKIFLEIDNRRNGNES